MGNARATYYGVLTSGQTTPEVLFARRDLCDDALAQALRTFGDLELAVTIKQVVVEVTIEAVTEANVEPERSPPQ